MEMFGVSSKYQKFVRGIPEVVTEEVEETVPGENGAEATTRMVRVPKLTTDGRKQVHTKFYTYEEVLNLLLGMKAKHEAMMEAQVLAYQAEMADKLEAEAVKNAQKQLSGSAI